MSTIKGLLNATPQQLEAMCTARKRWQVYSAFALAYSAKHRIRSNRSLHVTACGRHCDGLCHARGRRNGSTSSAWRQ